MLRDDIKDLLWFIEVAKEANFTRAAARLGTSQSTLSHAIKGLEARLGVRLLNRTTRNVSTTEAGERLFQSLAPRIADIETQIASVLEVRDKPTGTVRITLSDHALDYVVWPKLAPVLHDYPDVTVELICDPALRNIIEDRYDAGVRLGETIDNDMIAVRIGPDWRMIVVASPIYLASRGRPGHPDDLLAHNCINARQASSGGLHAWEFEKDDQELRVKVTGSTVFNTSLAMINAAVAGYGIAYVPEDVARPSIEAGLLETVLDDWTPPFPGYYLYYPSRTHKSAAMRLIVDTLRVR